jgi:hypothetical protein
LRVGGPTALDLIPAYWRYNEARDALSKFAWLDRRSRSYRA